MLHWFDSVILGIVEGLTEFLPVSSTGHMILTNKLLGYDNPPPDQLTLFEIVIQFAAILAIAIIYRQRIVQVLSFGRSESVKGLRADALPRRKLNVVHIALGIVPPMAIAFLFRHQILSDWQTVPVLWALVVGGIYMWVAEWLADSGRIRTTSETMDDITYKQALLIGILQCISVLWPGFSRSGSTIAAGLLGGTSYRASADFSFFIAIPIMTVATGYSLVSHLDEFRAGQIDIGFLVTGFIVSFLVAWAVVAVFLKLLKSVKLRHFAIYRFVLAACFFLFLVR
jgi:undecaprenyl-diphosphatase